MQFIQRKDNFLSKEECKLYIDTFEKSDLKYKSSLPEEIKRSSQISFYPTMMENPITRMHWQELANNLIIKLNQYLRETYAPSYPGLNYVDRLAAGPFNMQKYEPGEGFYAWHSERSTNPQNLNRVLAWMIYLNDLEQGGTEFQHQNHIEEAEAGKLLIWPSDWTHSHRGIVSESKTKYILTGWYVF